MATPAPTPHALTLGSLVLCADDQCGELRRIVLDPVSRRVTHLVVGGPGDGRPGWIVPIGLAAPVGGRLRLRCSEGELHELEAAKPAHPAAVHEDGPGAAGPPAVVYRETAIDQAAVRPGDRVRALDGVVGDAFGVLSDNGDPAQTTHLLVEVGPRGARRRVAVPIRRISSLRDGVQLTMAVTEVRELPTYGDGEEE
jgi:hypothetical protein